MKSKNCEQCGQLIDIDDDFFKKTKRCPNCGAEIGNAIKKDAMKYVFVGIGTVLVVFLLIFLFR